MIISAVRAWSILLILQSHPSSVPSYPNPSFKSKHQHSRLLNINAVPDMNILHFIIEKLTIMLSLQVARMPTEHSLQELRAQILAIEHLRRLLRIQEYPSKLSEAPIWFCSLTKTKPWNLSLFDLSLCNSDHRHRTTGFGIEKMQKTLVSASFSSPNASWSKSTHLNQA